MSARNEEKFKNIVEDWNNGLTREVIAEKYGYQICSINGVLHRLGISFARDLTKQYATIEQMYADGHTLLEIAKVVEFGSSTVKNYLVKIGVYKCKKTSFMGSKKEEYDDESNLTYAPPKQIKKVVDNGKRYDDVTEMLFQQYEG